MGLRYPRCRFDSCREHRQRKPSLYVGFFFVCFFEKGIEPMAHHFEDESNLEDLQNGWSRPRGEAIPTESTTVKQKGV